MPGRLSSTERKISARSRRSLETEGKISAPSRKISWDGEENSVAPPLRLLLSKNDLSDGLLAVVLPVVAPSSRSCRGRHPR